MTVEDYIEILAGIQQPTNGSIGFELAKSDYNLVTSLARQTFRGIAYTDRQYELAKTKLIEYAPQFEKNGYKDWDLSSLRLPIRSIDRSRWIRIIDTVPNWQDWRKPDNEPCIAVRFIFNKKLISKMENIIRVSKLHYYDKVEKTHYFPLNEKNLFTVISELKENNFEINSELLDYYGKLKQMNDNKNNHIPGIYGFKLQNFNKTAIDFMVSSIGEPSKDNLAIYKDRSELFGLTHFDQQELEECLNNLTVLSKKIVTRESNHVLVSPEEYHIDRLIETFLELFRFPLIVILKENTALDDLHKINKAVKNIIPEEDCSVLFRLDNSNEQGKEFNQYIQEHKLNNPLDINSKIVYINNNKLPKPMLQSDWTPCAALYMGSVRSNNKVDLYVDDLDLIVHYDTDASPFYGAKFKRITKI